MGFGSEVPLNLRDAECCKFCNNFERATQNSTVRGYCVLMPHIWINAFYVCDEFIKCRLGRRELQDFFVYRNSKKT